MYYLHQFRKFNLPKDLLMQIYITITQSVHCISITVWFGLATKKDRNRLPQMVRTAERTIVAEQSSGLTQVQSQETKQ